MTSLKLLPGLALLAFGCLGVGAVGPEANNAILFVGDGLGIPMMTAARMHGAGATGRLAMELPHVALVKTHCLDRLVTDSAAGATAMLSGQRVRLGVVGMNPQTHWACSRTKRYDGSANPEHPCDPRAGPIPSLADLAASAGIRVGVVTNTRITHATPAALYAHVDDRLREREIAAQLTARDDLDFVVGGGRRHFTPEGRKDDRDLLREMRESGATVVGDVAALRAAVAAGKPRIVGLLGEDHLPFALARGAETPSPSLAELTELAIRHLSRDGGRYLLLVEGGRIDHALHQNRAQLALAETLALDGAVARAREITDKADTLLVVTADHGHPLVITGYAQIEDSVLGLAADFISDRDGDGKSDPLLAQDGKAMTTLQFSNGPGFREPREDAAQLGSRIQDPNYQQHSGIPLEYTTHEGSDVMAMARGPGAHAVSGFMDLPAIFHVVHEALGL